MKNCNCKKAKEINWYEYNKEGNNHKFKPNYCPWCGASLEVTDRLDKFKKKHKKPYNKKSISHTWNKAVKAKDKGYNDSKW